LEIEVVTGSADIHIDHAKTNTTHAHTQTHTHTHTHKRTHTCTHRGVVSLEIGVVTARADVHSGGY